MIRNDAARKDSFRNVCSRTIAVLGLRKPLGYSIKIGLNRVGGWTYQGTVLNVFVRTKVRSRVRGWSTQKNAKDEFPKFTSVLELLHWNPTTSLDIERTDFNWNRIDKVRGEHLIQGAKPDRSFAICFNCTTGFGGNPRAFDVDCECQNKNSAVTVCDWQKQVRTEVRPRNHAKSCSEPTANRVKTGWEQFFPKRPPLLAVKWRIINAVRTGCGMTTIFSIARFN